MDINKKIKNMCFQRGWSMYDLAQESGITQSTLSSIMTRGNPPKIETLECICEAFSITLSQFFLEDESVEVLSENEKKLITLYRKLTPTKQAALIDLLNK